MESQPKSLGEKCGLNKSTQKKIPADLKAPCPIQTNCKDNVWNLINLRQVRRWPSDR